MSSRQVSSPGAGGSPFGQASLGQTAKPAFGQPAAASSSPGADAQAFLKHGQSNRLVPARGVAIARCPAETQGALTMDILSTVGKRECTGGGFAGFASSGGSSGFAAAARGGGGFGTAAGGGGGFGSAAGGFGSSAGGSPGGFGGSPAPAPAPASGSAWQPRK